MYLGSEVHRKKFKMLEQKTGETCPFLARTLLQIPQEIHCLIKHKCYFPISLNPQQGSADTHMLPDTEPLNSRRNSSKISSTIFSSQHCMQSPQPISDSPYVGVEPHYHTLIHNVATLALTACLKLNPSRIHRTTAQHVLLQGISLVLLHKSPFWFG